MREAYKVGTLMPGRMNLAYCLPIVVPNLLATSCIPTLFNAVLYLAGNFWCKFPLELPERK